MSDSHPHVSVIVVTHNSLPALSECLGAIRLAADAVRLDLVLVDNASSDESLAETAGEFPEATIISNKQNLGFAAACNQGADAARGEYLLFLNPDVRIDPGAIGKLVAVCTEHRKVGLVSGRLRFPDGSFQATCRNFPTIGNLIFSRGSFLAPLLGRSVDRRSRYTLPDYNDTTIVPAVAATMALMSKKVFEEAGRFDPRFFMYLEDTDLSLRLSRAGYVNLFVPAAGGRHDWGRGSSIGRLRRLGYHHLSLWRYFRKHHPDGFSLLVLPLLLLCNMSLMLILPGGKTRRQ